MSKIFYPVGAIFLLMVVLAACGGSPDPTKTRVPVATAAPAVVAAATAEPSPPADTAEPVALPTVAPTDSMMIENVLETLTPAIPVASGPMECPPDGSLDDALAIASCGMLAVQGMTSFSFDADMDLLALFPMVGAFGVEGGILISGSIAPPDRLRFQISFVSEEDIPETGGLMGINGIVIGYDTYVQDPDSLMWVKGAPRQDDFLDSLQMVGMLMLPTDAAITLDGVIDRRDGSLAYVIVSDDSGMDTGDDGFPEGGSVRWIVGVEDFLTREVRVTAEDLGGELRNLITISYHGYNEPVDIEPPTDIMESPVADMEPPAEDVGPPAEDMHPLAGSPAPEETKPPAE